MKDYQNPDEHFSLAKYLEYLDMLLTDDASDWTESHPDAIHLLTHI